MHGFEGLAKAWPYNTLHHVFSMYYSYKNDDTKAVDSMLFIDILRKDIIKVDAKNEDNLRI